MVVVVLFPIIPSSGLKTLARQSQRMSRKEGTRQERHFQFRFSKASTSPLLQAILAVLFYPYGKVRRMPFFN